MREIKFRGKSDLFGWVYGSYAIIDGSCHIFEEKDLTEDGHHIRQDSDRPTWVDPNTIGQYTGLKDADGKEIYEGDIVRYRLTDERYKKNPRFTNIPIHYDESQARFEAGSIYWDTLRSNKIEVIGNIHDNPEILNVKP